jgi:hypothetical protein
LVRSAVGLWQTTQYRASTAVCLRWLVDPAVEGLARALRRLIVPNAANIQRCSPMPRRHLVHLGDGSSLVVSSAAIGSASMLAAVGPALS